MFPVDTPTCASIRHGQHTKHAKTLLLQQKQGTTQYVESDRAWERLKRKHSRTGKERKRKMGCVDVSRRKHSRTREEIARNMECGNISRWNNTCTKKEHSKKQHKRWVVEGLKKRFFLEQEKEKHEKLDVGMSPEGRILTQKKKFYQVSACMGACCWRMECVQF